MSSQTAEAYEEYKRIRKDTESLVKQAQDKHWEIFSKRMGSDFYGLQKQIWRPIRSRRAETNELISTNHIARDIWVKYLEELERKLTFDNTIQNLSVKSRSDVVITFVEQENNQEL